jgi:hypothetical protein
MSDYETDIVTWADEQAQALRARSANRLDWDHLAEEIEDVGRSETEAVISLLTNAMCHKLRLVVFPDHDAANHWQHEIRAWLARVAKRHRASMHIDIADVYAIACLDAAAYLAGAGVTAYALPSVCPWTLDELIAEGDAARRRVMSLNE